MLCSGYLPASSSDEESLSLLLSASTLLSDAVASGIDIFVAFFRTELRRFLASCCCSLAFFSCSSSIRCRFCLPVVKSSQISYAFFRISSYSAFLASS